MYRQQLGEKNLDHKRAKSQPIRASGRVVRVGGLGNEVGASFDNEVVGGSSLVLRDGIGIRWSLQLIGQ